jgi:hypothetical protein
MGVEKMVKVIYKVYHWEHMNWRPLFETDDTKFLQKELNALFRHLAKQFSKQPHSGRISDVHWFRIDVTILEEDD